MLPRLPTASGARRESLAQFSGLDRRAAAGNGAICDMTNLSGDEAPLLVSRGPRYTVGTVTKPNGVFSDGEHLFLADGTTLYADGVSVGTVTDTAKVFAALGRRILVWPDKLVLRPGTAADAQGGGDPPVWVMEALEASVTQSATFADGSYAGEAAEGNTILAADSAFDWGTYFKAGDAVTVSGAADAENNKTVIVREIAGNALRFYEHSFTVNSTAASLSLARTVPDLDFLCVNDNRVWGCKGDAIRCCKLGDPSNWNVFDGLASDSWAWESGTAGAFTGCVSFLGYPVFFKEEAIFKIYGSKPSNFEAMRSAATGVLTGAAKSLAIAGDTLFYLSRAGFMAYAGGMPSPIDGALDRRYTGAVGGSDGAKYYVSAAWSGGRELLVWDSRKGVWHREDGLNAAAMAWKQGLYALTAGTSPALKLIGNPPTVPSGATAEGAVASSVVFADWDYVRTGSRSALRFAGKYPLRLWLRAEADQGVTLTVSLRYDGGTWRQAAVWTAGAKKPGCFAVPLARCDRYGMKIEATGAWKLYALEFELRGERDNVR